MIFMVAYLYVMGATFVWWFVRADRAESMLIKVLAAVLWPVMVPIAALWG